MMVMLTLKTIGLLLMAIKISYSGPCCEHSCPFLARTKLPRADASLRFIAVAQFRCPAEGAIRGDRGLEFSIKGEAEEDL